MGQRDEENPVSEDEAEAEREKLRPNPPEEMELQKIPIKTKDGHPEVIHGADDHLLEVHHLKYLLFGFNGFLSILGAALLAATIWVRADTEFNEYETKLNVDNFYTVCYLLIVAGLVILVVGVLGCIGAATEQRWMLILYMTLFGLILLIEIAALVIMWSAPYSTKITSALESQLKNQINERPKDDSSRYFMDFIQQNLHCCGGTGPADYAEIDTEAPRSCINPKKGFVYPSGCASKMLAYLRSKAGIVGGIALPILLIQLLALAAAGCLIRRLAGDANYMFGDGRY